MNCSMPCLPVHHQLLEFTQTHVHRVGDAIQPSHPLSSPFPPAPIPPSIRVFSNESTLCMRWLKYWSFSFSIIPSREIPGLSKCVVEVGGPFQCRRDLGETCIQISSVQFSHSVVSDSLRPHESQHARPPCPSPTPGVHSDSYPSSQ